MISVTISLNESQFRAVRESLRHIPGAAEKAIARALNRAVEGGRTDAIRVVCEEYTIRPIDVRKTIHIVRAKPGKLEAQIISTGKAIPLAKFNVKPKKPPKQEGVKMVNRMRRKVITTVKTGSTHVGRGEKPEWFVQKMASGHIGVFYREGLQSIKQEYRLATPQMLGNSKVLKLIEERAKVRLDKELTHQIKYLFGGGR
jgi:hypothetical protein